MVLSEKNLKILKSVSQINSQIYFVNDELAISINVKDMVCFYPWGVKLEQEFGIYDVNELLSLISLYKTPTISEKENKNKIADFLTIKDGKHTTKYKYTAKNLITIPPTRKTLFDGASKKISDTISTFTLAKQDLETIKKNASILKSPHIKFEGQKIISYDNGNSSCNVYEHDISASADIPEIVISTDNLQKLYSEDEYTVDVNDKMVIFKSKTEGIIYIIIKIVF